MNPIVKNNCLEDNQSDYVSSSAGEGEDSCDTVIYRGANGHISDRDLTDNERPPSPDTMKIMKLKLASSSEDETTEAVDDIMTEKKSATNSTNNLHEKLSSLEESETNDNINEKELLGCSNTHVSELSNATKNNAERAVNVVAPLVVVEKGKLCDLERPESPNVNKAVLPTAEVSKEVLIEQFLKSGSNTNGNDKPPGSCPVPETGCENVSEKSLRKQERRIEKLLSLASSMSEDESFVEVENQKNRHKNDGGYTSDHCYGSSRSRTSSKLDGYISAPEYSHNGRPKPVQVVRGTVRKQQNFDNHSIESRSSISSKLNDTSLDEKNSAQAEMTRVKTEAFVKVQMSFSKFSSIRETFDASSSTTEKTGKDESTGNENKKFNEQMPSVKSDSKDKIQNLNHIITVSPVPNFSVAKKPSLTQFAQSQPIKPNRLPIRNNETSLDTSDGPCSPKFERSYSREDTISLVSAYDSDAYESDARSSSYGTSPALGRAQRKPQRLRYRWSTVYEEVEDKKETKSEKHGLSSKESKRRETVVDSEAKPSRIITSPKSSSKHQHSAISSKHSLMSRLIKSPKADKKSISLDTPKGNKKYFSSSKSESANSPKSKGKFSLLSPRSERRNKYVHSSDKRMSGCSDASSGIDSGIQSQTSSLKSGEEIKVDDRMIVVPEKEFYSSKHRLWPFGYVASVVLMFPSQRVVCMTWILLL